MIDCNQGNLVFIPAHITVFLTLIKHVSQPKIQQKKEKKNLIYIKFGKQEQNILDCAYMLHKKPGMHRETRETEVIYALRKGFLLEI